MCQFLEQLRSLTTATEQASQTFATSQATLGNIESDFYKSESDGRYCQC